MEGNENKIEGLRKFIKDQQDTLTFKNDLIKKQSQMIDDYQEKDYRTSELILQLELENAVLKKELRTNGLFIDETGKIIRA